MCPDDARCLEAISDILPAWLGRFMVNTAAVRFVFGKLLGRGHQVPSTRLGGFLLLRSLASLRRFRRSSYRYRREMALIDQWLGRILEAARSDHDLALAIVHCQGLIKGYGHTHANGLKDFQAIMAALADLGPDQDADAMVKQLSGSSRGSRTGRGWAGL